MPLLSVVPSQKSIFYCADFGSTIAVNLQQKLKPFLYSSKKQMALQPFLEIYSFFVYFRNSFRWISVISSVFIRFVFRIYTFSCGTVLPPSKISSSCRSDYLFVSSFCYTVVVITTFYEANKRNPFSERRAYLCRFEVVIFQAIQIIVY